MANYAYDGMQLLTSTTYTGTETGGPSTSTAADSPNGRSTTINEFRRADFWLDTDTDGLSFNFYGGGIDGIRNT